MPYNPIYSIYIYIYIYGIFGYHNIPGSDKRLMNHEPAADPFCCYV